MQTDLYRITLTVVDTDDGADLKVVGEKSLAFDAALEVVPKLREIVDAGVAAIVERSKAVDARNATLTEPAAAPMPADEAAQ